MSILPVIVGLGLAFGGPPLLAGWGDKVFRSSSYLWNQVLLMTPEERCAG